MTSHAPDRMAIAAWRRGGARRYLLLGLILLAGGTAGCSLLIKEGHLSPRPTVDSEAIAAVRTHAEVQQLLGSPAEATPCPDGTAVEVFHVNVRSPGDVTLHIPRTSILNPPLTSTMSTASDTEVAVFDVLSLGFYELMHTPAAAVQVARRERYVAIVTAPDGAVQFRSVTARTLDEAHGHVERQGVIDVATTLASRADCPLWSLCVAAEVAALHRRAACLGYAVQPAEERGLQYLLAIALQVDAGRLPAEKGQENLRWCVNYAQPPLVCP